ncbi:hypothetical protein DITRI_Ditri15bG0025300 [Diplodiscus trichospermus]
MMPVSPSRDLEAGEMTELLIEKLSPQKHKFSRKLDSAPPCPETGIIICNGMILSTFPVLSGQNHHTGEIKTLFPGSILAVTQRIANSSLVACTGPQLYFATK